MNYILISLILIQQILLKIIDDDETITVDSFKKQNISLTSIYPFKVYEYYNRLQKNNFGRDLDNYLNYIIINFYKGNSNTLIYKYKDFSSISYDNDQFSGYDSFCDLSNTRACLFDETSYIDIRRYFVFYNKEGFSDSFWIFNNLGINSLDRYKAGDLNYPFQKIIIDTNNFQYNYIYFIETGLEGGSALNIYTIKGENTKKKVYSCDIHNEFLEYCKLSEINIHFEMPNFYNVYGKKVLIKFDLMKGENIIFIDNANTLKIEDTIKPYHYFLTTTSYNKDIYFQDILKSPLGSKLILEIKSPDINLHGYNIEAENKLINCENIDNNGIKCKYKPEFKISNKKKYTYFRIKKDNNQLKENDNLYINLEFKYYNSSNPVSIFFLIVFILLNLALILLILFKVKTLLNNNLIYKQRSDNNINELNSKLLIPNINLENEQEISFNNNIEFLGQKNSFYKVKKERFSEKTLKFFGCLGIFFTFILIFILILADLAYDPLAKYIIILVLILVYLSTVVAQFYLSPIYGLYDNLNYNNLKKFLSEVSNIHPILKSKNRRLVYKSIYDISGLLKAVNYENSYITFIINYYSNMKFDNVKTIQDKDPLLEGEFISFNHYDFPKILSLFKLSGYFYKSEPKIFNIKKFIEFEDKPLSQDEINEIKKLGLKLDYYGNFSDYPNSYHLSGAEINDILNYNNKMIKEEKEIEERKKKEEEKRIRQELELYEKEEKLNKDYPLLTTFSLYEMEIQFREDKILDEILVIVKEGKYELERRSYRKARFETEDNQYSKNDYGYMKRAFLEYGKIGKTFGIIYNQVSCRFSYILP